jgi:hypothetical protein
VRRFCASVMLIAAAGIAGCPVTADRAGLLDDATVSEEADSDGAGSGTVHAADNSGSGGAGHQPPDNDEPAYPTTSPVEQDDALGACCLFTVCESTTRDACEGSRAIHTDILHICARVLATVSSEDPDSSLASLNLRRIGAVGGC